MEQLLCALVSWTFAVALLLSDDSDIGVGAAPQFAQTGRRRNNVCNTFEDYKWINNSTNCWYNPDVSAEVPEIVASHGYQLETYKAVTEDGYILTVFRILPKITRKKTQVVFLEHPLTATAAIWVDKGQDSLAFMLADAGYDVWLGNARGSFYAKQHKYLDNTKYAYWNFTFHEIGLYDLPAQFNLTKMIAKVKDNDIIYIGHSMACTSALIYASLRPEEAAANVKLFIAMAPPAYFANVKGPFKYIAPFGDFIYNFASKLRIYEFLPHNNISRRLSSRICLRNYPQQQLCYNVISRLMGWNPLEINPAWVPIIVTHNPGGSSFKCVYHYVQQVNSGGRFQYYDYGPRLNNYFYHSTIPPEYPVHKIQVPFYIMYGTKDALTSPQDVLKLYRNLPKNATKYGIYKLDYNHLDFMYGRNIKEKVNEPILKLLYSIS